MSVLILNLFRKFKLRIFLSLILVGSFVLLTILSLNGVINKDYFSLHFKNVKQKESLRKVLDIQDMNKAKTLDKINPPGVIVKVGSGLGNQLFKYASSFALAKRFDVPLYLYMYDESSVGYNSGRKEAMNNPNSRKFILDLFQIPMGEWIHSEEAWESKDTQTVICEEILYNKITKAQAETKLLINGDYCHSEKYFEEYKDDIKEFVSPNMDLQEESNAFNSWANLIMNYEGEVESVSVAVHIRRGDYLKREYWVTPISYYRKAMLLMQKKLTGMNIKFFIFSDDMKYVKANLVLKPDEIKDGGIDVKNIFYVSSMNGTTTSFEEFCLMTLCKNIIVANSTFSWWAAYLIPNKNKIVIGPKFHPKFLDHVKDKHQKDFKKFMWKYKYPVEWIEIDPYNGIGL